jgi:hypothetical protein
MPAMVMHIQQTPLVWYGFFIVVIMKKKNNQVQKENVQFNSNRHRPDIRDNLDNRKNEEQEFKGDDITHNRKEPRKPGKKR